MKTRIARLINVIFRASSALIKISLKKISIGSFLRGINFYKPILALTFLLLASTVSAKIYYIAPAPTGSNTSVGDLTHPWLTLAYACTRVTTPGDIIHVKAGTYTESSSCALAVGVSIEGEGYSSHIIYTYVGFDGYDGAIKLVSASEGTNGNQSISGIRLDGNSLTSMKGVFVQRRSNVQIHDCSIRDFKLVGIAMLGKSFQSEPTIYATGNKIYNDTIINCAAYTTTPYDNGFGNIEMQGQSGMQIYNNYIQQNSRPAGSNGYIIKGVGGYNKGLLIHDNHSVREYMTASGHFDIAYELWDGKGGIEIYNNIIDGGSIDISGYFNVKGSYAFSYDIHDNIMGMSSINNDGDLWTHCIDLEMSLSDAIVRNNIFQNTYMPVLIVHGQPNLTTKRIYIQNNVMNNMGHTSSNGGAGLGILAIAAGSVFDSIFIQNNTFYDNGASNDPYFGVWFWMQGVATNIFIQNNIFQGFAASWLYTQTNGATGTIDKLYLQNNDTYGNGNSNNPNYYQITPTNITNSGNVKVNPLFVSAGSDFHLQTGSPCIDAGINVGLPFNGSAPDMGAFEYSSGVANLVPVIQNQSFQINENSGNGMVVGTVLASDPNAGQILTYSIISGNTNGAFAINSLTGSITVANSSMLNFETTPSFALVIKVVDNGTGNLSNQATVTINLTNINETPAISNQSFSVAENSTNGSVVGTVVASDPDIGQTKTYSIVSGNTNNAFAINSSTGLLTITSSAALNYEAIVSYSLVIKVQDNGSGNLSSQATIIITVLNINEPPIVNNQVFSVQELAGNGTLVGTIVATDPDAGQTLSYSILSGNTSNAFAINTSTGLLSVATTAVLNFESTPTFSLIIKVQDNGIGNLYSQATVTLNLTNINEPPIVNNQTFSISQTPPNGTQVGTLIASDPDAGQTMTYSITAGNTGNAFSINNATGIMLVANSAAIVYITNPGFNLNVRVTDNGTGNLFDTAAVTINVLSQVTNQPPVINNQTFSLNENSSNGTIVCTVLASDPDVGQTLTYSIILGNTSGAFAINPSTGVLSVAVSSAMNFEINPSFALVVKVQDNGTGNLSNQSTVTVNTINVNESPIVSNQSFSIAENSANGSAVGTVISFDPDAGQTKTYSIVSGNTNNAFAINSSSGLLTIASSTALNYETVVTFSVVIKVQDNGSGNLSSQAIIMITLLNINEPPVINNQVFSVQELAANGTLVGTVVATDPDAGQTRNFSISSGNANNVFLINATTGNITVANSSALVILVNPTYNLIVRVTDNGTGNLYDEAAMTITVAHVSNQSPIINNQAFSVSEFLPNGSIAGIVSASDPNIGQILTYSIISGNTTGAFAINSVNGNLIVANSTALNFQTNPSFALLVKVQDNGIGNLSDQAIISINIIQVGTCTAIGNITYQKWNNIGSSSAVTALTSNSNYPSNPTSTSTLTSMEAATNQGSRYGARIAGYICAPATGNYTFWIASDDNGELWISNNDQPTNKQKIAYHTGWTNSREWNKYSTQKSALVYLIQGKTYYIEALMKEASGGDNLAVGWLKPGQTGVVPSEVVPGAVLSPLVTAKSSYVISIISIPQDTISVGTNYSYQLIGFSGNNTSIHYSAEDIPAWLVFSDNGNGTGSLEGVPGIEDIGSYQIVLKGSDSIQETEQIFSLEVKYSLNYSLTEQEIVEMFIYPNPIHNGILNVKLINGTQKEFDLSIMDMNGRTLLNKHYEQTNSVSLDISAYPPAQYLVQIRSLYFHFSKKIIKQ